MWSDLAVRKAASAALRVAIHSAMVLAARTPVNHMSQNV
jgi:hypothetical protein